MNGWTALDLDRSKYWETVVYEREPLYAEVWAEPVRVVAKRYRISDVALAKICRKLGVPLPPRGYWARKAAGQNPPRTRLPPREKGAADRIQFERRRAEPKLEISLTDDERVRIEREGAPDAKIVVPDALETVRPLVERTARALAKQKPGASGMVHTSDVRFLDVEVSPAQIDRARRIMDVLITALEQRGLKVEVRSIPSDPRAGTLHAIQTGAVASGEWIPFRLSETTRPGPPVPAPPLTEWDRIAGRSRPTMVVPRVPSGRLVLQILRVEAPGCRQKWADGRTQRLEDLLNEFVAELLRIPAARRAERERIAEAQRALEAEERRRIEEQRRAADEEARGKRLDAEVASWRRAREIRAYVAATRRAITSGGCEVVEGSELDTWLRWALGRAEQIDPVARVRRDVAEHVALERERLDALMKAAGVEAGKQPDVP